jgi:pyruvate/2-oxoglutarate/acetoin dehydrogenase E1 component
MTTVIPGLKTVVPSNAHDAKGLLSPPSPTTTS